MAAYADIPIVVASPVPAGQCTSSYFVRYKLTGDIGWTLLNGVGTTLDNPIRIQPLAAASSYDYEITRNCCNGINNTTTGSFTTP